MPQWWLKFLFHTLTFSISSNQLQSASFMTARNWKNGNILLVCLWPYYKLISHSKRTCKDIILLCNTVCITVDVVALKLPRAGLISHQCLETAAVQRCTVSRCHGEHFICHHSCMGQSPPLCPCVTVCMQMPWGQQGSSNTVPLPW